MRYERRGIEVAEKAPRSRRHRQIVALTAVVIVAIAGIVVGFDLAKGQQPVVVIPAIAKPYLEANILIQNLGSPAPRGVTSLTWAVSGDALLAANSTTPHLAQPEREWLGSGGAIRPLSSSEAATILSTQRQLASSIMTGHLLSLTNDQLNQLVRGELQRRPQISSPGGGSIVTWLSITPNGDTAKVDADVEIWEQVDELVTTPTGLQIRSSINQAEIEGKATMRRVHGTWKVVTLDQQPYQQAT
jgi:hypothetical protein